MFDLGMDPLLNTRRGVSGVSVSAHLRDMRNIGLPSEMKLFCVTSREAGWSLKYVYGDGSIILQGQIAAEAFTSQTSYRSDKCPTAWVGFGQPAVLLRQICRVAQLLVR